MCKVTILLALLSTVGAANINDFYGNYTIVMAFSNRESGLRDGPPTCVTFAVSEDDHNSKCTCDDGNDCTYVELRPVECMPIASFVTGPDSVSISMPMLAVDKTTDINLLKNVICHCGDKDSKRGIVKKIHENYIIMSDNLEEAKEILLAQKLPSNAEFDRDFPLIDEIKNRTGFKVCTREIREKLLSLGY
ncbi:hypothetical protein PYW07_008435 [Mythimna separata]|uniref:Uncharacterized protein n=1 Tax=Mythimna separata TaxID=271217 RepID=A0AAD7YDR0_MYTSE|nr:hypothetical protein PYW07_008435 [Mythimna separata]